MRPIFGQYCRDPNQATVVTCASATVPTVLAMQGMASLAVGLLHFPVGDWAGWPASDPPVLRRLRAHPGRHGNGCREHRITLGPLTCWAGEGARVLVGGRTPSTPASDGAWTAANPHKPGTAVPPGATYTYDVLPSSVGTWPYHDHSTPFHIPGPRTNGTSGGGMSMGEDTPTMEIGAQLGLIGMLVLTEPGETRPDREFYLILHDLYAADIPSLNQDYDCFNGRAYLGNTPTFSAAAGQRVRWPPWPTGSKATPPTATATPTPETTPPTASTQLD